MEEIVIRNTTDLFKLCVGVEHADRPIDETGLLYEVKSVELFKVLRTFRTDKASRQELLNLDSGERIYVDESGDCTDCVSDDVTVYSVTNIHPLTDTIDDFNADVVSESLKQDEEAIGVLQFLKQFVGMAKQENAAALVDRGTLDMIIDNCYEIYTAAYGDPFVVERKVIPISGIARKKNNGGK